MSAKTATSGRTSQATRFRNDDIMTDILSSCRSWLRPMRLTRTTDSLLRFDESFHATEFFSRVKIQRAKGGELILDSSQPCLIAVQQPDTLLSFLELGRVVPHHIVTIRKQQYDFMRGHFPLDHRFHLNECGVPVRVVLRANSGDLSAANGCDASGDNGLGSGQLVLQRLVRHLLVHTVDLLSEALDIGIPPRPTPLSYRRAL